MEYLNQLATYPSLLIGPIVVGAVISAAVSLHLGRQSRKAASKDVEAKIVAERGLTDLKIAADRDRAFSDREWADYILRRDIYLDFTKQVHVLFDRSGMSPEEHRLARRSFNETTRKLRVIGSAKVVKALNELTASIKSGFGGGAAADEVRTSNLAKVMNIIRQDIRNLELRNDSVDELDDGAFPIES